MGNKSVAPTAVVCCFTGLINSVARINDAWKRRWGSETPGFCFRGADDDLYDLNPSLLRSPFPSRAEDLAKCENNLWVDFRLRSRPLLGRQVHVWEALLIMQQYGFPTRLLDWTRSLAIAAYFAVREKQQRNGVVWVMAGRHLMETRGVQDAWRTVVGDPALEPMRLREGEDGLDEFNTQKPVVLMPDQFVQRMVVQRGLYTLHTFQRDALEMLAAEDRTKHSDACYLHKIVIPAQAKLGLLEELSVVAGVSEEMLFPDLEGFARDFVAEQKRRAARDGGTSSP